MRPRASAASSFEIWRKVVRPTQLCCEAKSFGRSSIDAMWSIGALDARLNSDWQGSFPGLVGWPLRHCEPSFVAIVAAIGGRQAGRGERVFFPRDRLVGNTKPPRRAVLRVRCWAPALSDGPACRGTLISIRLSSSLPVTVRLAATPRCQPPGCLDDHASQW
jgi:hypothetical protein